MMEVGRATSDECIKLLNVIISCNFYICESYYIGLKNVFRATSHIMMMEVCGSTGHVMIEVCGGIIM